MQGPFWRASPPTSPPSFSFTDSQGRGLIMQPRTWSSHHPIQAILLCFVGWKSLLLLIAACSPGPGYDTSTSLSLSSHVEEVTLANPLHYMIGKLTRWDAIYFVRIANRGYLFEQEWAFGWGFTRLIASCTTGKQCQQCSSTKSD
jgi:GPI mannosyltransferase 2